MQHFDEENNKHLFNCIPPSDIPQFVMAYNKIADELTELEHAYREKYAALYPDFNMDSVISFSCNNRLFRYAIDINKHYSKMEEEDKTAIQYESIDVLEYYLDPQVYRSLS